MRPPRPVQLTENKTRGCATTDSLWTFGRARSIFGRRPGAAPLAQASVAFAKQLVIISGCANSHAAPANQGTGPIHPNKSSASAIFDLRP